jgi:hypothetical protein
MAFSKQAISKSVYMCVLVGQVFGTSPLDGIMLSAENRFFRDEKKPFLL